MVNDGVVKENHIKPQPYPFLNQHMPNVNNATEPTNLGISQQ